MSWKTTFDGQFGKFDAQNLAVPQIGAGLASLAAPRAPLNGSAEQIMVQANENNPGVVVIGQVGTMPSGFRLAPGGAQPLPDNDYRNWRLAATLPGCTVTVIYVAGPK